MVRDEITSQIIQDFASDVCRIHISDICHDFFGIGSLLSYPPPVRYFTYVFYKLNSYVTGIQIPIGTKVGKGLTFPHYSCIVISKRAMIGENCTIFQGVTLGKTRKDVQ